VGLGPLHIVDLLDDELDLNENAIDVFDEFHVGVVVLVCVLEDILDLISLVSCLLRELKARQQRFKVRFLLRDEAGATDVLDPVVVAEVVVSDLCFCSGSPLHTGVFHIDSGDFLGDGLHLFDKLFLCLRRCCHKGIQGWELLLEVVWVGRQEVG